MKVTEDQLIDFLKRSVRLHENVLKSLEEASINEPHVSSYEFGAIEAYEDVIWFIENGVSDE